MNNHVHPAFRRALNAISPEQQAHALQDAWGRAYDERLRVARRAHADKVRASDALLGLAFSRFAAEQPEQVGKALRQATTEFEPYLLALACEVAIAEDANAAVDVPPSHDLFPPEAA